MKSMFSKNAAVLAYNENVGSIQVAASSSALGFKSGTTTPDHCLSQSNSKTYPLEYSLYKADTGNLWTGDDIRLYYFNTTTNDANGLPWPVNQMYTVYHQDTGQPLSPQPTAIFGAYGDGEWVYSDPWMPRDLTGDGTNNGYFPIALPDGSVLTAADGEQYRLKAKFSIEAPHAMQSSSCNSLVLKESSPVPTALSCGSANANRNSPIPTAPSQFKWVNGVKQF